MTLPAIDAHAHIQTHVSRGDMAGLDAFVVAVTNEPDEWAAALARNDPLAVWAIGVHPCVPKALAAFDGDEFASAVGRCLLVGEVGLDGRSKSATSDQRRVFDQVLRVVSDNPRPTTIHSVAATRAVLDALQATPIEAPILHWWRGSRRETEEAIEMGCFFSINGAEARRAKVIDLIPPERILTETDFPHSQRADPAARRPAAVSTIEKALMETWGLDAFRVRQVLWRNLAELYERCELSDELSEEVQDLILAAGMS